LALCARSGKRRRQGASIRNDEGDRPIFVDHGFAAVPAKNWDSAQGKVQSAMSKSNQFVRSLSKSPFLWGVLGAIGFYILIRAIPPNAPGMTFVLRYFTHHPVEYMETVLFSVGLAALVVKVFDVAAQRSGLRHSPLGPRPESRQSVEESEELLAMLDELPARRQGEYYIARLRAALQHVWRHESADKLDDELKYFSDVDAARLHASFGLFRVIVWAIPILGFLGTVIGITMALNSIDMNDPVGSMRDVLSGLGLKFDTTALALAFAMILMFVHFYVERAETALLAQIDGRMLDDMEGRFAVAAASPVAADGQSAAVRRMAEAMMQATDSLVHRQAELWQSSVDTAARQWAKMSETAAGQVQTAMSAATGELASQTDVLRRAVEAAGEVTGLEDALNRNLAALAGAKHFEQTVLSLAAAVNMLSARLAESPNAPVRLESTRRSAHAA
jgi:biopolymer transport protein ExbB/TolQ